ncbi:MAG: DUF2817 domain-containing protein [Micavibrio aeruginosavorus]|uniref:DUF2817 domain-containing protein n=1 Tax=Micavibrio aeruginosavorus TaxID=349221 RepID=A0A7T5R331_9BACT|nr:MAG: DUF2817 domain-containing protein [Micavibrio aeruginosavorus]
MSNPYFSQTYREARDKFLQASSSFLQSSYRLTGLQGPDGGSLYTDVAYCGNPGADKMLVVSSGLHGIEGFAGSAVQGSVLARMKQTSLPDDVALLFVHALNPYGFAHDMRTNADNIDLNRNFHDWAKGRPADHRLAGEVQDILFDPSLWRRCVRVGMFLACHGLATAQAALTQGQYTNPQGLFYGGQGPSAEARLWRGLMHLHGHNKTHIAHIDLHTGLGPRGYGEIIVADGPGSLMFNRSAQWWGAVTSLQDGSSVSAQVSGDIAGSFNRAACGKTHTLAALEFGTVPGFQVVKALLAENQARLHGRGNLKDARQKMREAFYPRDPLWQESVLARGGQVVQLAVAGLRTLNPESF